MTKNFPILLPSSVTSYSDRFWEVWQERPADKKFEFGCIMHKGDDMYYSWNVRNWSHRQLFRFYFISEQ